jgi:ubiquitin
VPKAAVKAAATVPKAAVKAAATVPKAAVKAAATVPKAAVKAKVTLKVGTSDSGTLGIVGSDAGWKLKGKRSQ